MFYDKSQWRKHLNPRTLLFTFSLATLTLIMIGGKLGAGLGVILGGGLLIAYQQQDKAIATDSTGQKIFDILFDNGQVLEQAQTPHDVREHCNNNAESITDRITEILCHNGQQLDAKKASEASEFFITLGQGVETFTQARGQPDTELLQALASSLLNFAELDPQAKQILDQLCRKLEEHAQNAENDGQGLEFAEHLQQEGAEIAELLQNVGDILTLQFDKHKLKMAARHKLENQLKNRMEENLRLSSAPKPGIF